MSYAPHTWANGQNGADAVARLNNIEEGLRAATQALEDVGADYAAADPTSLYRRSEATLQSAQQKNADAQAAYNAVTDAQTMIAKRNSIATLYAFGGVTGPGVDLPAKLQWEYSWGILALYGIVQPNDDYTLIVKKKGWYMFHFYFNIRALVATMKIQRNGVTIDTLKLAQLPVAAYQENGYVTYASSCICVTRYFEAGSTIGFKFTLEGFSATAKSQAFMNLMLRRM